MVERCGDFVPALIFQLSDHQAHLDWRMLKRRAATPEKNQGRTQQQVLA
jgi:hypothetical protein